MLDPYLRVYVDPLLNQIGAQCRHWGWTPNGVTLVGFFIGLCAMWCIVMGYTTLGVIALLFNRVLDGVDGAIARHGSMSDFGGVLDLVCDFTIYAGIVFACLLRDSTQSLPLAFLLFSFIGPITSFLGYAIMAAKRNWKTTARGHKSLYYLGGICEGTETMVLLFLLCLFPEYVAVLAYTYSVLCWVTTIGRVLQAKQDFSGASPAAILKNASPL